MGISAERPVVSQPRLWIRGFDFGKKSSFRHPENAGCGGGAEWQWGEGLTDFLDAPSDPALFVLGRIGV